MVSILEFFIFFHFFLFNVFKKVTEKLLIILIVSELYVCLSIRHLELKVLCIVCWNDAEEYLFLKKVI